MTALLWLRRDLRVHDHPAMAGALSSGEPVVPVFVFDERLLHGRHASGPRTQLLLDCLADLNESLRQRGSRLVLRRGAPERELSELARSVSATALHYSADVGPYARRRDGRVTEALAAAGVEVHAHPGVFAVNELAEIRTQAGHPYTVFSPFHRAWLAQPRRAPLSPATALPALPDGLHPGHMPSLSELGLDQQLADPLAGGERAGRERMRSFLEEALAAYGSGRDALEPAGVSQLSPYLHFGCISPRELEWRLIGHQGEEAYARQLCWRDFFAHVMLHFPRDARSEHQQRYRARLRWNHAQKPFDAWREGHTGFPLVDAGMRQLRQEGWMHNRARMVVGSFLTKDLGIDWRWGERWFMRLLLDGDQASNNGNWQWIASVGVDPQPPFKRIFNPARQQARFDPAGSYVRRYVPELRGVPDRYLPEPARMPPALQAELGCVIGRDYPEPIVDHGLARRAALARYAAVQDVSGP